MPQGRPTDYTPELAEGRTMPSSGIYALLCPETKRVMYIGQSKDIYRRYKEHCRLSNNLSNRDVCKWLKSLIVSAKAPILRILELTEDTDEAEVYHIKQHNEGLLNMTPGGKDFSPSARSKSVMPWGKKQAPIQKAMIAAKRVANKNHDQALINKLHHIQNKLAKIKQDTPKWIAINLVMAQERPALKTWSGMIKVGDNWY